MFQWQCKPSVSSDIQSLYRQIYYEALDFIINAIQKRFEQPNYQIYVNLGDILLKTANTENFSEERKVITELYDTDFDADV